MKILVKPYIFTALFTILLYSCGNNNANVGNNIKNNSGIAVQEINQLTPPFSSGTQEIIKLQMREGSDIVVGLNCSKYDVAGKAYCENEKKKVNEWKNEITWEVVFKKGVNFIKNYDCNKIYSIEGQDECRDYKKKIPESKNIGGVIQEIKDATIILQVTPINTLSDTREIHIGASTKIYKFQSKTNNEIQKDIDKFEKKIKEDRGDKNGEISTPSKLENFPFPLEPMKKVEASIGDLKPHANITVISTEDIQHTGSIGASEIYIN